MSIRQPAEGPHSVHIRGSKPLTTVCEPEVSFYGFFVDLRRDIGVLDKGETSGDIWCVETRLAWNPATLSPCTRCSAPRPIARPDVLDKYNARFR